MFKFQKYKSATRVIKEITVIRKDKVKKYISSNQGKWTKYQLINKLFIRQKK